MRSEPFFLDSCKGEYGIVCSWIVTDSQENYIEDLCKWQKLKN